jgi:hypothetical protein
MKKVNVSTNLSKISEEKRALGNLGAHLRIILECILLDKI